MHQRKRLFVDPHVQGALILRVVGYWFYCLLTMATALLVLRVFTGPARIFDWKMADFWHWYGPAAVASLLLLIVVVIDAIRMSNRFVGPLYRVRREMQRLAAGEAAEPVRFRDGDYWQEFADEFNAVAQRMELLEAQARQARTHGAEFKASDFPSPLVNHGPDEAPSFVLASNGHAESRDDS